MQPIFDYMDYRVYLKDYLKEKRTANPNFSQRLACRKIGLKSPGHLSQIMGGKANISLTLGERIIDFLGLKAKEGEYFRRLVLYCQAKTHMDKKTGFERLLKLKQPQVRVLHADQYEFYDKWFYTAVREVLSIYPFRGDFAALGKSVVPNISPQDAEKAIRLLERLGLVQRNARGVFEQTGSAISTGYGAQSLALDNFVVNAMELAKNALNTIPGKDRNLSWATFTVSQPTFLQIEDELRAFRRRIQQLANGDPSPDRAYQINFQLFPISPTLKPGMRP